MCRWKAVLCLGMVLLLAPGCGKERELPSEPGTPPPLAPPGQPDGGRPDGGRPDGGQPDGGQPDGGPPDGGPPEHPADAGEPGPGPGQGGPDGGWWKPKPGTSWQIQLSGPLDTSFDVEVYDVDLFDTPAATIAGLHSAGRKVICYFSAGSFEDWRPDTGRFPEKVIGTPLAGWPGERWLDIRAEAVREVMRERLGLAVQKGCDGVDPDNVDGYRQITGFALTPADQLDFNRFLATEAHARGLAVGLKNDIEQVPQLMKDFDWFLSEQCFEYGECHTLKPFIQAGKPVFAVEYGGADLASRVCPRSLALDFDTLVKNLELDAARISCR